MENSKIVLSARNISKYFDVESGFFLNKTGIIRALDNVSFDLIEGQVLGIIGESGSGKTTLAKVLCNLINPDSGKIEILGKNIKSYSQSELSNAIQMIFQNPYSSLNPKLTVGTILKEALNKINKDKEQSIKEILQIVGLSDIMLNSYPHQFSGGQRQRIAIARALLKNPKIMIADEPLSSLDVSIGSQILELFKKLKNRFLLSFIFISHDIITTALFADYVIVMKNGKIIEKGETKKVIISPEDLYTKKLIASVPKIA
ncbi:MAG: ATP-binding cassette domain-containing protein [Elusimicrobia bacterium]|nr:ATP-binding cassette domain-containing protein [Elusimicrobiota bacterium]